MIIRQDLVLVTAVLLIAVLVTAVLVSVLQVTVLLVVTGLVTGLVTGSRGMEESERFGKPHRVATGFVGSRRASGPWPS
jgi:hypothetical protein